MFWTRKKAQSHEVQGRLSEYIDDVLSPGERRLVENHLKSCQKCSGELNSLMMAVRLLRQTPEIDVPRSFALRPAHFEKKRAVAAAPAPRWLRPAAALAAVTAMALAFLVVGDSLHMFEPQAPDQLALSPTAVVATPAETAAPTDRPADKVNPVPTPLPSPPANQGLIQVTPDPQPSPTKKEVGIFVMPEATPEAAPETGNAFTTPAAPTGSPPAAAAPVTPEPKPAATYEVASAPSQEDVARGVVTWPLRQIEIALAAVLVILGGVTVYSFRRRRNRGY